jgi:molecular chaperone DnaJ
MSEDFYDVLGVSRDATDEEIEQAYRKKAAKYHPDVSDATDAEERFKKIKKAKEVLTDDEKRRMYDQVGHERFREAEKRGGFEGGGAGGGRGRGGGNPFGGAGGGQGSPFEDIFNQFFGGGGGRGGGGSRPRQGSDLRTQVTLDLEEVYEGVEKQFTVTRPEECPECRGRGHPADADVTTCSQCNGQGQTTTVRDTPLGRVQQTQTCPRCDGAGETYSESCSVCGGDGITREDATLTVDIPAGIQGGQTLRMEREGAPGENGGPNGDLLIDVSVRDHDDFERDGDDLYYRLPISFPKAVFGASVEVPTVTDATDLDIPAGTQSGEEFRLRGEGMPHLRGRGHGDLYVQVQVVTPDSLTDEQRDALEAFAEAGGEDIDVSEGFFEKIKRSF